MARTINTRFDALFVEGPDDGAVINALIYKLTGIELAKKPYLVRTNEAGGGDDWALRQFDQYIARPREDARVGVIVDRDGAETDKWPAVRDLVKRLGGDAEGPRASGTIGRDACLEGVSRLVCRALPYRCDTKSNRRFTLRRMARSPNRPRAGRPRAHRCR
jgi:hypothetical protein